jgi:hypothetical protein
VPPTWTSAGFAEIPSIVGQMFSLPSTSTVPVRGFSRQVIGTTAEVVMRALTSNPTDPVQVVDPSLVVATIEIWNPVPAGIPPIRAVSVVDPDMSIAPFLMNPIGPVIE